MSTTSELTHLFRQMKAPTAAEAMPKLAERARGEEWSYERFTEALLATEVSARQSHGGRSLSSRMRHLVVEFSEHPPVGLAC